MKIPVEEFDFWKKVAHRRMLIDFVHIAWLVVGLPLWYLIHSVMKTDHLWASGIVALLTWLTISMTAYYMLSRIKCFSCGQQALGFGSMLHRKQSCVNCGTEKPAVLESVF